MQRRGRTFFQLEGLQPDWASRWLQLAVWAGMVGLIFVVIGPFGGGLFGLLDWLLFEGEPDFVGGLIASGQGDLLAGVILGLILGIAVAGLGNRVQAGRSVSNQGIRTSLRNALRFGGIGVPLVITALWLIAAVLPDETALGSGAAGGTQRAGASRPLLQRWREREKIDGRGSAFPRVGRILSQSLERWSRIAARAGAPGGAAAPRDPAQPQGGAEPAGAGAASGSSVAQRAVSERASTAEFAVRGRSPYPQQVLFSDHLTPLEPCHDGPVFRRRDTAE